MIAPCSLRGVSEPDPTHGHTPPDPVDVVAPGVGAQLAQWTIAAMAGDDAVPDADADTGTDDARAHRRVIVTVAALRAALPFSQVER